MRNANLSDEKYYQILHIITRFLRKNIYLILFTIGFFTLFSGITEWNFQYIDTDNYMRAIRLHNLILNPSFFEQIIHQTNYPFGEINHWTRPMDILWLFCTTPFLWLSDIKEAIFFGGIILNPILGILCIFTLAYGLRRHFNIYLVLLGCLLLLSSNDISILKFNIPDHHSLMLLLGIYSFSLTLCWLKKRQNRYIRLLGFSLALATFTAIEGIILYALFLCFFTYIYIYKKLSLTPAEKTSKYFAFAITFFWLINPPYQGYFYPDNGRLSILFVVLSWLIYLSFKIINNYKLHTKSLKITCLFLATITSLVSLILIFGTQILHSPLDSELNKIWSHRISEIQSITYANLNNILTLYTTSFIALIINLYLIKNKPYNRILILNLIIGLPLFLLSLYAQRFTHYQPIYSIIPFICIIDRIYKKSSYAKNYNTTFPSHVWLLIFCIFFIQQIVKLPNIIEQTNKQNIPDYSTEICTHFQNIGGTIATDTFLSPQYIWNCNINAVASPYHRNRQGIIDNHNILFSEDDNKLISLLLKHQVTLILVPTNTPDDFYKLTNNNQNKLYYRLLKQEKIPNYLKEIPLKTNIARLYKIKI